MSAESRFAEYTERRRQRLRELVDAVYTEQGGSVAIRVSESVRYDGNWFVADAEHGRWQIAVSTSDDTPRWLKYERPYVALEQIEDWQPA